LFVNFYNSAVNKVHARHRVPFFKDQLSLFEMKILSVRAYNRDPFIETTPA
jgi:hypothetical protein